MKRKYLAVLADDPTHTHEFYANSPEEVKCMIRDSDVPEDKIESITLAPTKEAIQNGKVSAIKNPFTGEMEYVQGPIESAIKSGKSNNHIEYQEPLPIQQNKIDDSKIFLLGGIEVKIQNGIIYQKDWITIDINKGEYRLVNNKTGRVVKSEQYVIQKMDWVPVPQVSTPDTDNSNSSEKLSE